MIHLYLKNGIGTAADYYYPNFTFSLETGIKGLSIPDSVQSVIPFTLSATADFLVTSGFRANPENTFHLYVDDLWTSASR